MTSNDGGKVCSSGTIYMVLLILTSITPMSIGGVYIYFYWHMIKTLIKCHIKYINEPNKRN